jgi:hypothetical protein
MDVKLSGDSAYNRVLNPAYKTKENKYIIPKHELNYGIEL